MPPLPAFFLLLLLLAGFVPPAAAQSPPTLSLQPGGMLIRTGHILPPTEVYFNSDAEIDGLRQASNAAVSGDLLFVTAEETNNSALSVWQVNAEAGTLSQTAVYRNGGRDDAGKTIGGLNVATGIAVSGDGALLFVTASFDDTLSVWRVNAEAGTLSQTALYQDSRTDETADHHIREVDGRFDGLDGAQGAAVSSDGALLFVTGVNTLSVWRVNAEAGTLSQTVLYRNNRQDPNDANKRIGGLGGANDIAVSGDLLFAASQFSDAISVWRVNAEAGTLSQTALYQDSEVDEMDFGYIGEVDGRVDGLDGARGAAVSGDGALLFVTGFNTLSFWRVNAEAGTLSQTALYQDSEVDETDFGYIREVDGRFDGLSDAQSAAVSGDGALLFVTASFDDTLSVWRVNAEAGTLSQTVLYLNNRPAPDDASKTIYGLNGALGLTVSSDLLFVTARFSHALSAWRINSAEVPLEVPAVISMQSDLPVAEEVMVTVTAQSGADSMDARPVTLSPGTRSADAIFPPGVLSPGGRWIFTAQAQPPAALDTRAVRIAMRVLPPLLSLEAQQERFALGSTVALTVRTIAGLPAAASYAIDAINTAEESTATITVEYPADATEQEVFFPAQQIASLGLGQLDFSIRLPDNSPFRVGDGSTAIVQIVIPQLRPVPLQQQFALDSTVILTVRAEAPVPVNTTYDIIALSTASAQTSFTRTVEHPAGATEQEVSFPARLFSSTEQWEFSIRLPDGSPFRIGDGSTATVQIVIPQLRLVPLPEQFALGSTVLLTVRADPGAPTEATYDIIARHLASPTTFPIEVTHPAGVTAQEVSVPALQITSPGQWEFSIQLPEDSPFQVIANGTATVYVAPVLSLLPQRESFPAGVAVNIGVQAESPPAVDAAVTITARRQQDGVEVNAAEAVTLSPAPEVLSGQAMFPAGALGDGVWVFTAQSEPPEALYTANARAEAAVLPPPLRLEVSVPPSVTVGNTFTVTVGVAAGRPLPEGVSVAATVSFGATDSGAIAEREVTLTGKPRTATEEFTAPVRSGIFRVEISGPAEVSGRAVIGASASVTVVPVAVMLQLSAPDAVPVRQDYQVTVDTVMPVPAGTTLEVTVTASAGTEPQEVSLTAANPSEEVPFTAPLNVGEVIVTARAEVQTAPNAREVAVAAAMTQTVRVLAEGIVALTLDAPLSVTVGDTFTVTVGVAEETPLPESVSVTATISLRTADGDERERKEVVLTSASSSVRTAFTAPVTAGLFTVAVSGREETDSIDGVAGTSAQVSVEAVAVRLQLSGPAAVFVGQGYQVTVGTNMTVPAGTTLEVTVTASTGTDLQVQKDLVSLTADNSEEVPFTAPLTAGAVMVTAMAEVQTAADAREVAVPDATTLAVLIITPAALSLQPEGMLTRMEHAVFTETYVDSPEFPGLSGSWEFAVSGDLLFVTASDDNALSVWRVNAEAGTLSQTVVYQNGDRDDSGNTISGLDGASGIAVSGNLLFVVGFRDNVLSVWRVNAEAGTLSQTVVYQNGDRDDSGNTISGLDGASAIAVSGNLLFVGGSNNALSVWRVNESSGTLGQTAVYLNSVFDGVSMAVSDNLLFVTAEFGNALSAWRINAEAGTLSRTDLHRDGLNNIDGLGRPTSIAVSGDGALLFVTTGFLNNALSAWRVNAEEGTLSQAEIYRDGVNGIDGLNNAQNVAVSGDLLFVVARDALSSLSFPYTLSIWRINAEAETGILRQIALHPGELSAIREVRVSGDVLFVLAENAFSFGGNAISVWHINNAELPFGEPLTIRVQSDTPVLREVEVTVTARNGAEMARDTVSLSPENLSAEAIFAADDLVPGRWIFTAEAEPSTLLDTSAARIAVQVPAPVRLTLDVPDRVTVGDTLTVTVGVDEGVPLPEGASVIATLSFSAGNGDEREVMLTSEMSSATEIFTAPVTAGIFRVEVSGRAMIGTSASVIVEPVAVILQLNGPQEAVSVGQTYMVTVDTNMPVPTGTMLEVTVSAGTAPQEVVFLTAANPSEDIPFTAPRTAGAVMVTATATVQTAMGALEVAVPDAATLAVTVSAQDVQLVLSGVPDLVAAGSTFPVTVGTAMGLPEGAAVLVTVSLAALSSEPMTLTPSAPTARVIVTAPPAGGAATLSATGEEAADSMLELNVLAAEAVQVQVQVQVSLSLRLEAPPEVTARDSFAVTVSTEPEVPGGVTVTVTVAFDGTDSSPVVLSAEMASTAVMFTAPSRIENDLELMTSSVVTVADANVLQVVVTEASATVNAAAQSVQLTLVAMPERVAAGQEVTVTAGVSPALLADTTLTVQVFFGEASSQQVTLSDKVSSQEVSFPTSATGTLEVNAQAVAVEPADLVVAAAAQTQTVEVLAEGTVELTLDAPKSVTVGSTFPVTVGVAAGTPLPDASSLIATIRLSFRTVDNDEEIEMEEEVVLTPAEPSEMRSFTAPVRSGILVVEVSGRAGEDSLAIRFVLDTSAQVSVEPVRVTLTLGGPDAVTVGEIYQVMVGTDMTVPEGTELKVTVSDGTVSREVSLAADNNSEEVSFTAPANARQVTVTATATVRTAADALEVAAPAAKAVTVQVQVEVLHLELQQGQPLTAGNTVILTVQLDRELPTDISYSVMALHTVSEMTTSVLTIHPADTTTHSVSFSGQQIASPGQWEFSIVPAESPFEGVPTTATISLDFIQPQGTINADDLVFALRYLVRCEGSAAGCQANRENLASLARNLGNDLRIEQLPAALQLPNVSGGGEEMPAANWFILLLGLQGLPVELLFPTSKQEPRQLEKAIRNVLSVQEE